MNGIEFLMASDDIKKNIKIEERGWPGHLCVADDCLFHRNTLISYIDKSYEFRVVLSTVGKWCPTSQRFRNGDGAIKYMGIADFQKINSNGYYETKLFFSDIEDQLYHDAYTSKEINLDRYYGVDVINIESDMLANNNHNLAIEEITKKIIVILLEGGVLYNFDR